MFEFLKRKNKEKKQEDEGTKFTFVWYKKMVSGNKTHYTAPFRTKVTAKTRKEAIDKLTNFALQKMTLEIYEEKDFEGTEISKMQKTFDRLSDEMEKMFGKLRNK